MFPRDTGMKPMFVQQYPNGVAGSVQQTGGVVGYPQGTQLPPGIQRQPTVNGVTYAQTPQGTVTLVQQPAVSSYISVYQSFQFSSLMKPPFAVD